MTDVLPWALERAREQTLRLITDVPAGQSCLQAVHGEHHPTWILGHLLLGDTYLLSLLRAAALPRDFQLLLDRYGPDSVVKPSEAEYDSFSALVERLVDTSARRQAVVGRMSAADLNQPMPDSTLARSQPTLSHHLHALVCHEGYHAGQLAAWRRSHGLPPVQWAFATPASQ